MRRATEMGQMHERFAGHQLFRSIPSDVMELIFGKGQVVEFGAGEQIVGEHEPNLHLYLVLDGELRVSRLNRSERNSALMLGVLGPGDLIGEYSFFDGLPASATVTAEKASLLYRLDHQVFRDLLASDPLISSVVYRNMLEYLVNRLRTADDEFELFSVYTALI